MAIRDVVIAAAGDDAVSFHNHSGFSTNNSGALGIQQHVNTSLATTVGWRFKIPSDINPAHITSVKLRLWASATYSSYAYVSPLDLRIEKNASAAFANDATNMPSHRHNTAVTNGVTQRNWTMPTATASSGLIANFPDISTDIKAAMNDGGYVPGSTYVGILAKAPIGGPNSIGAICQENGSTWLHPALRITYTDPAPSWPAISATNVNYHDSVGYYESRMCDIDVPAGAPPPGGRPTVVYLHGGFWRSGQGSRTNFSATFRDYLLAQGYTVVNASYKLVASTITISNTWASYPDPVHDMVSMMNFLTNSETAEMYQIDPDKIFLCGASAGGHVALSAALGISDANNYTGYQNTASNRSTSNSNAYNYGNTRPIFDLDRGGAGITPMPRGVFLIVAPVDLGAAAGHPDVGINAAINLGRTGYMGQNQGVNPNTTVHDELDLNKYIAGTSTVYGAVPKMPAVPIGYAYAENDAMILPQYGHQALATACAVHGSYEVPAVGTLTRTGLSRMMIPGATHDNAHLDSDTWPLLSSWIENIITEPSTWKPQIVTI